MTGPISESPAAHHPGLNLLIPPTSWGTVLPAVARQKTARQKIARRWRLCTHPRPISPASCGPPAAQGPDSRSAPVDCAVGRLCRTAIASTVRVPLLQVVLYRSAELGGVDIGGRGGGFAASVDGRRRHRDSALLAEKGPEVAAVFDAALDGAVLNLVDDALRCARAGVGRGEVGGFIPAG